MEDDDEKKQIVAVTATAETYNRSFSAVLADPTVGTDFALHYSNNLVGEPNHSNNSNISSANSINNSDDASRNWVSGGISGNFEAMESRIAFHCERNREWKLIAPEITSLIPQDLVKAEELLLTFFDKYHCKDGSSTNVGSYASFAYSSLLNRLTTAAFKRELAIFNAKNKDNDDRGKHPEETKSTESIEMLKLFPVNFLLSPSTFLLITNNSNNSNCSEFRSWIFDRQLATIQREDDEAAKVARFDAPKESKYATLAANFQRKRKDLQWPAMKHLLLLMIKKCSLSFADFQLLMSKYPDQKLKIEAKLSQGNLVACYVRHAVMNDDLRWLGWFTTLNPSAFKTVDAVNVVNDDDDVDEGGQTLILTVRDAPVKNVCYLLKRQLVSAYEARKFFLYLLQKIDSSSDKQEKLFQVFLYLGNFYTNTFDEQNTECKTTNGPVTTYKTTYFTWKTTYEKYRQYALVNGLKIDETGSLPRYQPVLDTIFSTLQEEIKQLKKLESESHILVGSREIGFKLDRQAVLKGVREAIATGDVDWLREKSNTPEFRHNSPDIMRLLRSSKFVGVRQFFVDFFVANKGYPRSEKKSVATDVVENDQRIMDEQSDEGESESDGDDEDEDEEESFYYPDELKAEILHTLDRESLEFVVAVDNKFPVPSNGFSRPQDDSDDKFEPLLTRLIQNPDERVLDYFLKKYPAIITQNTERDFRKLQPRLFVYLLRRKEFAEHCVKPILNRLFVRADGYPLQLKSDRYTIESSKNFIFKLLLLLGNFSLAMHQDDLCRQVYAIYVSFIGQLNSVITVRPLSALMLQYLV